MPPAGGESTGQSSPEGWLVMGGGLALILGAFLPWTRVTAPFVGTIAESGTEAGDGWFLVALGVVLAAIGGRHVAGQARIPRIPTFIVAFLAGAFTLSELVDASDLVSGLQQGVTQGFVVARVGVGLWLAVAGVVSAVIGVLLARSSPRS